MCHDVLNAVGATGLMCQCAAVVGGCVMRVWSMLLWFSLPAAFSMAGLVFWRFHFHFRPAQRWAQDAVYVGAFQGFVREDPRSVQLVV